MEVQDLHNGLMFYSSAFLFFFFFNLFVFDQEAAFAEGIHIL